MGKMFDPDDVTNPFDTVSKDVGFTDESDFEDTEEDIFKDDTDLYKDDFVEPTIPETQEDSDEINGRKSHMFDRSCDWANEDDEF